MCCMLHDYVKACCCGLCCTSISTLTLVKNSSGGPCLLPSLEKGGWRPVSPPSLLSPLPLQRPAWWRAMYRGAGSSASPGHVGLGANFASEIPRLSLLFSLPPIGNLYIIAVQRFLSKRWQRFKKLPVPRYRVDRCRRCGNLFHKHKQSRGELHEFNRSGHPAKPTLIQLFRVCCQHDHRACIALCS